MDYHENVQKSIDYIEHHLKDNIDIHTVVLQSGYSTTHFYRIFQPLIGETVKEYICKRKLSHAAIELSTSNRRLIDIAFEYGFNSQEVFTRAFSRLFGITPGRYRVHNKKIVLYEKVDAYQKMLRNLDNYIEPRIILEKEFRIVGIKKKVKPGDTVIRCLWDEFKLRKSEIDNVMTQDNLLGLCEYMQDITDESEFNYIASVEVTGLCNIPDGMITKSIPSSIYAVFTHMGDLNELKSTYNNIYGAWLPNSGYELAELDTIEMYYSNSNNLNSILDIYIPLK